MRHSLALLGGGKAVSVFSPDMFHWPIVTHEDEEAVLEVLQRGAMSGTDITVRFEDEFAAWQGSRFALAHNNGTAALHAALFACGVGPGDEVICPSVTYWASATPVLGLGADVVFADIDPVTLCMDPADIEHRITPRTKAIMVVHYFAHPADMDPIVEIAARHGVRVVEDVSHAQGGLYKGRKLGTIGDVGAMSLMSGKSFAVGEGGMLVTDDRTIWERAAAFGHYERFTPEQVTDPDLSRFAGLPIGGVKYRMHQMSSAVGRVQLRHYDSRCAVIRSAMNRFWDLLEGVPGLRAHRVEPGSGSDMAGWYAAHGHYVPEELEGLSVTRFAQAVRAEGAACSPGANRALHTHPLFREGWPGLDRLAEQRPIPELPHLPVSDALGARTFFTPWFKHDRPDEIEQVALAYRKVAEGYRDLLPDDPGNPSTIGGWSSTRR
jgi:perosamine synthetase